MLCRSSLASRCVPIMEHILLSERRVYAVSRAGNSNEYYVYTIHPKRRVCDWLMRLLITVWRGIDGMRTWAVISPVAIIGVRCVSVWCDWHLQSTRYIHYYSMCVHTTTCPSSSRRTRLNNLEQSHRERHHHHHRHHCHHPHHRHHHYYDGNRSVCYCILYCIVSYFLVGITVLCI